jgi:TonB family protein
MGESSELRFKSLEFSGTHWTRWAASIGIHASALLVLIAIPVTVERVIQPQNRIAAISLSVPPPRPKPILKAVKLQAPIPPPVIEPTRKVQFQPPPLKPPPVRTMTPIPAEIPKPLEAATIEPPKIELTGVSSVRPPVIKQDVFQANISAPPGPEAPVQSIKNGGFGDRNGVPSNSASTNKGLTAPILGAFDSPAGQATRAGGGRGKAVASAGFGSAAVANAVGNNRAPVQAGGFGNYVSAAVGTPAATPSAGIAAPTETPVEITFKPKPLYTSEARNKKVEGEVELEVVFSSAGEIRVLRVIHGLGFGLDENARAAANQIRFHPGTRQGAPVDVRGTVHIVFELS